MIVFTKKGPSALFSSFPAVHLLSFRGAREREGREREGRERRARLFSRRVGGKDRSIRPSKAETLNCKKNSHSKIESERGQKKSRKNLSLSAEKERERERETESLLPPVNSSRTRLRARV